MTCDVHVIHVLVSYEQSLEMPLLIFFFKQLGKLAGEEHSRVDKYTLQEGREILFTCFLEHYNISITVSETSPSNCVRLKHEPDKGDESLHYIIH